jgi:hypothetical protein
MANNPDFKLGDEYTGPAVTADGRVINTADGTYVQGGVRYVWTGEGDNFMPEGGWSDTPEQLAADELHAPGGELNPLDEDGNPLYTQVIRADGSVQPGGWANNPDYYVAQERPADFDAVDSQNRRKYIVGEDRRGNPTYTLNPDYNKGTTPGTTPGTTGTQDGLGTESTRFPEGRQNAFDIVKQVVTSYGLDISLADEIWAGMKEARSPEGLAFEIRQTDAYAARFPGMQMRKDLKLPAITEAVYLQLERDYREIFRAAALPDHFSDGPEDFAKLISGDVSPAEVQTRVSLAEQALDTANQDTVLQLVDFYGLTRGDLVSYYLDPEAAVEVFGERISLQEETRRMGTARLSAAAGRTLGTGLSKATAEQAQRQGVAAADLSSALAQRAGLTADLIGSEGVTADVLVAGDLLGQAQERARIRRTAGGRAAPFARGGGALTTGAGVTGFGAAE